MEILKQTKVLLSWNLSRLATNLSPELAGCFASKIWFTPLTYKGKKVSELWVKPEYFYVKGLRISSYMTEDSLPGTVVLVHGWGGVSTQFDELKKALLLEKRKVISFDFHAHGNSRGMSTDLFEMKLVLDEVLNRVEGPIDLICHSFGLLVAGQVLKEKKIRSLVSISSPHSFDFLIESFLRKTKLSPKIKPSLITHIQARVKNKIDVQKDIDLKSEYFPENTLLIHDENDREIPISEFHKLHKLKAPTLTMTTKGLGHNRILANSHVINQVISFLRSSQTSEFPMVLQG